MCFSFSSTKQLLRWSIFVLIFSPVLVFASVQEEISKGDAPGGWELTGYLRNLILRSPLSEHPEGRRQPIKARCNRHPQAGRRRS